MKLPDDLKFRNTVHGSGERGMFFYIYEDSVDFGVQMEARREAGARIETQQWRHQALPDQHFPTLAVLAAALEPVTEEQAAAEAGKWPTVTVEPEGASLNNSCRLCPREPFTRAVHRVRVATSWCSRDGHYAGLCDTHRPLADDATALIAALDAEVAERRARAAARGRPW